MLITHDIVVLVKETMHVKHLPLNCHLKFDNINLHAKHLIDLIHIDRKHYGLGPEF